MRDATVGRSRTAAKSRARTPAGAAGTDLQAGLALGYGIARLARLVARDATRRVAEVLGLSLAEWRMLLVTRPERPASLEELADRALLEKSHASIAATALAAAGLVRRAPSAEDRRRVLFTRTARGTRAVDAYLAATAGERRALWSVLSPSEQATLQALLARVLERAETALAEGGGRRAGAARRQD